MTETHEYTEAESGYGYAYEAGYDYGIQPVTLPEAKTLSPVGDIATSALTVGSGSDPSLAQALARSGHPAGTIEFESGVSVSVAQMNERRSTTTR